jgi:outer membrane protein insertion porin family
VSRHLADTLDRFDIYSDVQATLEDSPSIFAQPGDVDLVLNVKEASRFHARMATDFGNQEGNAVGLSAL